jgi:hypothetical protein
VIGNPPLPFRGAPPDRDAWVLAQDFRFNAQKWRDDLPDPDLWPPELDVAPDRDGWHHVDRRTVFEIGERATEPLGAAQTLIAADVWGTGTRARGRSRCLQVFRQSTEIVGNGLAAAAHKLRADGPLAAYAYLYGDSGKRIKYLGPSFGTKFLYFSGYGRYDGDQQPLILDDNVAAALNRLCGLDLPTYDWSASQYAEYLIIAHAWARAWGTTPDVIERILFSVGKVGKAYPLVISILTGLPLPV